MQFLIDIEHKYMLRETKISIFVRQYYKRIRMKSSKSIVHVLTYSGVYIFGL